MTTTSQDLPSILAKHKLWLDGDPKGERADLSGADLSGANLSGADLSGADLSGADLSGANLYGANLARANLAGANLAGANLYGANLARANLAGADLAGADLYGANLAGANLAGADLYGANLARAKGSALAIARTRILPEGSIIGWKKCQDNVIVKLMIPAEARRSHAFGRKCRAEYAVVIDIIGAKEAWSKYDKSFVYRLGDTVKPDCFSVNWADECAPGIHFFITRDEAEDYEP